MMLHNPQSPEEWQIAVNLASAVLMLDSMRQYGLVEGGPSINIERALEVIEQAKILGFSSQENVTEQFLLDLARPPKRKRGRPRKARD